MRIFKYLFFIFSLLFFISFFSTKVSYASTVLFEDNFNDGNYNNWEVKENTCMYNGQPAPWIIRSKLENPQDKEIGMISNGGPCFSKLVPTNAAWNFNDNNYIVEFDMELVQSSDYAFLFRYYDDSTLNGLHIQVPNDVVLQRGNPSNDSTLISYGDYSNGQRIHFKIYVNNNNVKVYRDYQSTPIIDHTYLIDPSPTGRIGLHVASGSQYSEVYYDNIKVTSIDDSTTSLNVPLIKQTDPLWKSLTYDSANIWNPLDPTIGRWGCALTSAVMVFHYHNITKMPDGSDLNPNTLNTWLKSQPDGYVNGGNVNWPALSRLSNKAKSENPLFTYDALEYKRIPGADKVQLTNDLTNNIPEILEEPGHFIVAKGINGSTFAINDPYYSRTLLTDYGNTFMSMRRFTPSHTDLSYLLFYTDKDTTITVKDSDGNEVGDSYIQYPIENLGETSGQSFRFFLLDKPTSNTYTVSLNSSTPHQYTLHTYLYDTNGEVVMDNVNGILGEGEDTYILQYNKDDNKKSQITSSVSFDSVESDIKELKESNHLTSEIANKLTSIINDAKNPEGINHKAISLANLGSFKDVLNQKKEKGIDETAYQVLKDDIKSLTLLLVNKQV